MNITARRTAARLVALSAGFGMGSAMAADLVWEVESPFRFFKKSSLFEMHQKAFDEARGRGGGPVPANVVWRVERRLNDPDCTDKSSPEACQRTRKARYEASRLGWAAHTVDHVCYDRNSRPRRHMTVCERQYSWGTAKEDYILPDAHTVHVQLSPERLAQVPTGDCVWSWKPRAEGGREETRKLACKAKLVIPRVPYAQNRAASGVSVKVTLPNGQVLANPDVIVDDLLVVALGDSFASGESNPDRPVMFSGSRQMVYDPSMLREEMQMSAARPKKNAQPNFGLASAGSNLDPKMLPRRRMEDEEKERVYRLTSREFQTAFDKRSAQWLSADCHRSLYGYPFRVGIQLALENRHRSVTFVSLACSGSDVFEGLFTERDVREGSSEPNNKKTPAQFDHLANLICRTPQARTQSATYALPVYSWGSTQVSVQNVTKQWCLPQQRKRSIDLVLLSIGGNDVGFGSLVTYGITESASDLAPIAGWIGHQIRYSPDVSRVYLRSLDRRIKAVRDALADGFGVIPSRVVQNAYEPIQYDENGQYCGLIPTLGMDVHPKLRTSQARVKEISDFSHELTQRLECTANGSRRGCPAGLATGAGTGFHFVTEHLADFNKRGFCAREPNRAHVDGELMAMPRRTPGAEDFEPYSPSATLPYGRRWRLVHTPNDAFLTAHTHREGISLFDVLQPAYAALYSGAFHPTAEGHAIVADRVMARVRGLIDKRDVVQAPR